MSEEYLGQLLEISNMSGDKNYFLKNTTLGEIGEFTRGNGLQKKDFRENGNPVIHYGQIYTKYGFSADKTISYVDDSTFAKLRKAKTNDILMATTSENVEDVAKCLVWCGEQEVGFSGDMYCYSTSENSRYLAYYFQTTEFQKKKERKVTGTKLIRIHANDMRKINIVLPPLEIQKEIVNTLDKFNTLTNSISEVLPKEIELRQKQYEYYRERLLSFPKDEVR